MSKKIKLRQYGVSTTVRNIQRVPGLLFVLDKYLSGEKWTQENQEKYQIRLIQHKFYTPTQLSEQQSQYFEGDEPMTLEQAQEIWNYQRDDLGVVSYGNGPDYYGYRGRMTANPLMKIGLCYNDDENKVTITKLGRKILNKEFTMDEAFVETLLKYQLPTSKEDRDYKKGYNLKPLVATLHLIKKVDELCEKNKMKVKGISKEEFNLFIHTLKKYSEIEKHAKNIIEFRKVWETERDASKKRILERKIILSLNYELTDSEREKIFTDYLKWEKKLKSRSKGISFDDFLKKNKDPLFMNWKTLNDYGDNSRRYFIMSGWIGVKHGKYIQLKESMSIETESLLDFDDGSVKSFDNDMAYSKYVGDETQPIWPWKTKEKLSEIYLQQTSQIKQNKSQLNMKLDVDFVTEQELEKLNASEIGIKIKKIKPVLLQSNLKIQTKELESSEQITEIITSLDMNYMTKESARKAPVELEYQTTRGLLALNDGDIMPNYPKGVDGEPTSHAGGGKPDIECFYEDYDMVCEVTLLKTQDQWKAESISVPDHFEKFIKENKKQKNFCLFIAPQIHERTIRTFYTNNQWEEKEFGRTVPLTISQFKQILETLKKLRELQKPRGITHKEMGIFYQRVTDSLSNFSGGKFLEWRNNIQVILDKWIQEIIS